MVVFWINHFINQIYKKLIFKVDGIKYKNKNKKFKIKT